MFRSAQHDTVEGGSGLSVEVSVELGCWNLELLPFHIPNRRESRHRLTDSRELSRCDYLIDVFVSWAGFLSEARP